MIGWWSEQFAAFRVQLTPSVGVDVGSRSTATMDLVVAPSLSMEGAGTSVADFSVTVAPEVTFIGQAYVATIALNLTPTIGMESTASNSVAAFELSLTPTIGMAGAEHYTAQFAVTVTPTLAATAYVKQLPHPIPWTL